MKTEVNPTKPETPKIFGEMFFFFWTLFPKKSKVTLLKDFTSALGGYLKGYFEVGWFRGKKRVGMHDFLIAAIFVGMVTSSAVFVASPVAIKRRRR
jgi:hypothetical protein